MWGTFKYHKPYQHEDGHHIPPALLHPIFSEFVDDCKKIEVTSEDSRLVDMLLLRQRDFYPKDGDRIQAICKVLNEGKLSLRPGPSVVYCDEDAHIYTESHSMIVKSENDIRGFHGKRSYLEDIALSINLRLNPPPPPTLPRLILVVLRGTILFAVATHTVAPTFKRRPAVQLLSTVIPLSFHETDRDRRLLVSRHFAAFRKAVRSLDTYHDDLEKIPQQISPTSEHIFPYKTNYTSVEGCETEFKYEKRAEDDELVFFGIQGENNERICVKFSQTYSLDAHMYLASLGRAPSLRGLDQLGGGWFMSVSDALHGFETLSLAEKKGPLPSRLFDSISATLEKFHGAGFVHGNFRSSNVMVSETDATKFRIINFDLAGKHGDVHYPNNLNDMIERLEENLEGKLIEKEHDLIMMRMLRQPLSKI